MDKKRVITSNKKARHDYFIEDVYECGIELLGTEVKSIKDGRISISEAYAEVKNGEIFLVNCRIAKYPYSKFFNHDPLRPRKLLLHKHEIKRIASKVSEKGYTLIPLSVYDKNGWIKVELALVKGKRKHDKREELKKREHDRDMERVLKRWKIK